MNVIVLAARKGGVGKTLMTASLAVLAQQEAWANAERPPTPPHLSEVVVIDFDPQGCLTNWKNTRASRGLEAPVLASMKPDLLPDALVEMSDRGVRHVFIDTPPGHSNIVGAAMRRASLVVVPVKPGELDLAATERTVAAATRLRVPHLLLPNDATFRSRAMGRTIRVLEDAGMPLLPPVHHRVATMLRGGMTVTEREPDSRGAHELTRVWAEIRAKLEA